MIEIGIVTLIMTVVMFVLCMLTFLLGKESTYVFSQSIQKWYLVLSLAYILLSLYYIYKTASLLN